MASAAAAAAAAEIAAIAAAAAAAALPAAVTLHVWLQQLTVAVQNLQQHNSSSSTRYCYSEDRSRQQHNSTANATVAAVKVTQASPVLLVILQQAVLRVRVLLLQQLEHHIDACSNGSSDVSLQLLAGSGNIDSNNSSNHHLQSTSAEALADDNSARTISPAVQDSPARGQSSNVSIIGIRGSTAAVAAAAIADAGDSSMNGSKIDVHKATTSTASTSSRRNKQQIQQQQQQAAVATVPVAVALSTLSLNGDSDLAISNPYKLQQQQQQQISKMQASLSLVLLTTAPTASTIDEANLAKVAFQGISITAAPVGQQQQAQQEQQLQLSMLLSRYNTHLHNSSSLVILNAPLQQCIEQAQRLILEHAAVAATATANNKHGRKSSRMVQNYVNAAAARV